MSPLVMCGAGFGNTSNLDLVGNLITEMRKKFLWLHALRLSRADPLSRDV